MRAVFILKLDRITSLRRNESKARSGNLQKQKNETDIFSNNTDRTSYFNKVFIV